MNKNKGSALVETLIALGVAVLIIGAITGSVISSLRNAEYAKKQNIATQYAQQGIEIIRGKVRTGWNSVEAGNYCLAEGSTTLVEKGIETCWINVENEYSRIVSVNNSNSTPCGSEGNPAKKVDVSVMWTDNRCSNPFCHDITLSSCFTNFNEITFD